MASSFIHMVQSGSKIIATKQSFYRVVGFLGVTGCVDGSHVPLIAPQNDELAYVNRKNSSLLTFRKFVMEILYLLTSRRNCHDRAIAVLFFKILQYSV